ncbi:uncharacterized protein LOC118408812 [Branchiostoma floridae]|uniref:Uncharacterized protein LOC118408812 n=1 Tax=Branchiostoma floridae TaxID=7739 RepID=A0A9J7HVT7_BRAFL|nr:uncharacterized protein LOC118408812 [Branchiostoma floridae]
MPSWTCRICLAYVTLTLSLLLTHMRSRHGSDPDFFVRCVIDDCDKSFNKYNSFYRHMTRQHPESLKVGPRLNDSNYGEEIGGSEHGGHDVENDNSNLDMDMDDNYAIHSDQEAGLNDLDELNAEENVSDFSDESDNSSNSDIQFDPDRRTREAARFICAVKERNVLTQAAVDDIVQATDSYVGGTIYQLRKKVQRRLIEHGIDPSVTDDIFEEDMSPFEGLRTAYLQEQAIKAHLPVVEPNEVFLGQRLVFRRRHNKLEEVLHQVTFQYVPIIESIEQLLNGKGIFDMISDGPALSGDGYLRDICDGSLFQTHPVFYQDTNALQIILYYDDVEIDNPLGSYAGKHKVGMFYYSLGNIPHQYRSKLEAIRLVAIVNTIDIKEFQFEPILKDLVEDLKTLSEGYLFNVNGEEVMLRGAVVAISADTNACLAVAGFKEGVGFANMKCRHCECPNERMQTNFHETYFALNSQRKHLAHLREIDRARTDALKKSLKTLYGINRRSILLDIPHFDISQMLPSDIMHVMLEGVIPYECREVLRQMIFVDSLFTLRELNTKITTFKFGQEERKNKFGRIPDSVFQQEKKLKMTADQTWIFIRHVSIILSSLNVDPENEYFVFLNGLCEITSLVFASVTSNEKIVYLRGLISRHLEEFKRLFPDNNILPKQHYLIHIPSMMLLFGPLIRIWCMRFEGKHSYFKKVARQQNHVNIPKSLAQRNKRKEASESIQENHPIFSSKLTFGPCKQLAGEHADFAQERLCSFLDIHVEAEDIYSANWVQVLGTMYNKNHDGIVAFGTCEDNNFLPEFGQIEHIWIVGGERVCLALKVLNTEGFVEAYQGYEVSEPDMPTGLAVADISKLLDHNIYYKYRIHHKFIVPIKYDLSSVIDAWNVRNE